MKVKELIKALHKANPEDEVLIAHDKNHYTIGDDVIQYKNCVELAIMYNEVLDEKLEKSYGLDVHKYTPTKYDFKFLTK